MKRRTLLVGLSGTFAILGRASAQPRYQLSDRDRADVARIETYLNAIKSLKAHFLQVAPDGGISRGTAWLVRPGRMRFEYDPPSPLLLVAGHGLVVFHDSQLEQTSNIPLGQTPLGLLLRDAITLSGDVTVTGFERQPGLLRVTMVRTASPGDGSLSLSLSDDPLTLRQWSVVDAQRRETRVSLYDIEFGGTYDAKLFEFVDPKFFQGNQGR